MPAACGSQCGSHAKGTREELRQLRDAFVLLAMGVGASWFVTWSGWFRVAAVILLIGATAFGATALRR